MLRATSIIFLTLLLMSHCEELAAYSEFQRVFLTEYTKGSEVDKDFRRLARKAKCNLCHQGKKDRANYNRYGDSLVGLLTEDDKKNKEKVTAVLQQVAKLSSDGEGSLTFGDLIAAGQLPGGSLEESKREPDDTSE